MPLDTISDCELLLLILSSARPRPAASEAAERLLNEFGTLQRVLAASPSDMAYFGGLSAPEILALKSVHIAALRLVRTGIDRRPVVTNSRELRDYLTAAFAGRRIEEVRVLFLDPRNHLLADEVVATGDIKSVHFSTRELIRRALRLDASALIVAHNHPSGDPKPSDDDMLKTLEIVEAAAMFGIAVHDHVIVSQAGVFSFKSVGLLPVGEPMDQSKFREPVAVWIVS